MLERLALLLVSCAPLIAQQTEPLFNPPIPNTDLRTMLRRYVVRRAVEMLETSKARRDEVVRTGHIAADRKQIRERLLEALGDLPYGARGEPLNVRVVSRHDRKKYRIENVLFESLPGWDVNATVYLPPEGQFRPPWIPVIMPVGHSGKHLENEQIPAQVLARCGFLVVIFDPPGVGEKNIGNDHFRDGVRWYLTGNTPQKLFVIDALRAIDYVATRPDADMSHGVGMTGVSGGGFTTLYASVLDDRIKAAGPSCFSAPETYHPIRDLYTPCPEGMHYAMYRDGLESANLLLAVPPTPMLFMAGREDAVFRPEFTGALADQAAKVYSALGCPNRFKFFLDQSGHAYTIAQAFQFARWMDLWVTGHAGRTFPEIGKDDVEMLPVDMIRCRPRPEENMFTINRSEAERLAKNRSGLPLREAAMRVAGIPAGGLAELKAKEVHGSEPFYLWGQNLREVILSPERDIELPATFVSGSEKKSAAVLYFDDRGRWTDLYTGGLLAGITKFIQKVDSKPALLTVDLRGWGDTRPAPAPFDVVGWATPERWFAYVTAAMGDHVLAMRIRDGLAALAYLRSLPDVDPARIVVGGHGAGGLVALHVAAIDGKAKAAFVNEIPASFGMLARSIKYTWEHDVFLPNVLLHYDIDEMAAGLGIPVLIANPLDPVKRPVPEDEVARTYPSSFKSGHVTVRTALDPPKLRSAQVNWINTQW